MEKNEELLHVYRFPDRVEYRLHGTKKLHRTDGPAVEWTDGSYSWWNNGSIHRADGPAAKYPDGTLEWFINGKEYTFKEYIEKIEFESEDDRLVFMMEWS